jgi:gluconate kinase
MNHLLHAAVTLLVFLTLEQRQERAVERRRKQRWHTITQSMLNSAFEPGSGNFRNGFEQHAITRRLAATPDAQG